MAKRIQKTISIDASILIIIERYKYENKCENLSDAFNDFIIDVLQKSERKSENIEVSKEIKELKLIISSLVSILEEKGALWLQK